jgi:Tol biopolymer transport system component
MAPFEIRAGSPVLASAREPRLRNVRRLTAEGSNAEAYWSPDGRRVVFQATVGDLQCDQIFVLDLETGEVRRITNGGGRATCGFFLPDGRSVLYSSTVLGGPECPPVPPRSHDPKKYVWPIFPSYDVFVAPFDEPASDTVGGTSSAARGGATRRLTDAPGYDAEATVSPRGDRIVFTSTRDGDIEIYSMNLDGSDPRRLTHSVGYDGGPFYSPDGSTIVFRADSPANAEEEAVYRELLSRNLVNPTRVEILLMNADGSGRRAVTRNGAANFAPCFFPDGKRILFSSNFSDPEGREFQLYACDLDGGNLETVTHEGTFNCFPHFSPDGRRLLFISNRFAQKGLRAYDVLVADVDAS